MEEIGSGWRFITGAWTEKLENFESKVIDQSRTKNKEYYSDYEFPKTRRISNKDEDNIELFGFVKLTQIQ